MHRARRAGAAATATMRRYHDAADTASSCSINRGCAAPLKPRQLEAKNTWDLVADMEGGARLWARPLEAVGGVGLGRGRWHARRIPTRSEHGLLRGISDARAEIEWFYQEGAAGVPRAFRGYRPSHSAGERGDMIAHYRPPPIDREYSSARARWAVWEGAARALITDQESVKLFGADTIRHRFCQHRVPSYSSNASLFEYEDRCCAVSRCPHKPA